jgi:hypothetical protein
MGNRQYVVHQTKNPKSKMHTLKCFVIYQHLERTTSVVRIQLFNLPSYLNMIVNCRVTPS